MQSNIKTNQIYKQWLYGFIAGFLATLTFHQGVLLLLNAAGIAPIGPYNMAATQPWGIPAVISLAFWGGVWGILFALMQHRFPGGPGYWLSAFLFGAVLPSLVAFFLVAPLKGRPLGGGWHWQLLLTAFLINGVWGLGTGFILRGMRRSSKRRQGPQPECSPGMVC